VSWCFSVAITAVPNTNVIELPIATGAGYPRMSSAGGHEERSAHPEEPEEHPDHEAEDDEEREETRSQSE